ncbi:type II pantothenate kinase [Feifania hominis]|uniref:Type II pantothenate kinase n=1 Tax=Feifania hominis TaxID=2763660 RepID=A0A926DC91_9FIRM|nr:type II pantothenate kinase [Feifania hominis]MBC8535222.1 type II pantothenate kinase [Feifania hominis]
MGYVIGIDIGGSTTKIVGYRDGEVICPMQVRANDPIASLYGAFGKFVSVNSLTLAEIDRVMITGVGSSYVKERIYGIKTGIAQEFGAIGRGGLYLSGKTDAIIVSMGTGTAYVHATESEVVHVGGTGVGGGTLLGLSGKLLDVRDFDTIVDLARGGRLDRVDLNVSDISSDFSGNLTPDTTASNFGRVSDTATKADLALGIINLVFQTIGMIAIFATKITGGNEVVLTGNLTTMPQCHELFLLLEKLYQVKFIIPEHAEFATAIGAALAFQKGVTYREID